MWECGRCVFVCGLVWARFAGNVQNPGPSSVRVAHSSGPQDSLNSELHWPQQQPPATAGAQRSASAAGGREPRACTALPARCCRGAPSSPGRRRRSASPHTSKPASGPRCAAPRRVRRSRLHRLRGPGWGVRVRSGRAGAGAARPEARAGAPPPPPPPPVVLSGHAASPHPVLIGHAPNPQGARGGRRPEARVRVLGAAEVAHVARVQRRARPAPARVRRHPGALHWRRCPACRAASRAQSRAAALQCNHPTPATSLSVSNTLI